MIAVVLCCMAFAGCASSLDTGVFSVSAPSGWGATMPIVENESQKDKAYIIKDGKDPLDTLSKPYIEITYYSDPSKFKDTKSFYKDSKDITKEYDGEKWEGYTYTNFGTPGACLTRKDGDAMWSAVFVLKNGSDEFSLDDDDVKDVLSSLKAK